MSQRWNSGVPQNASQMPLPFPKRDEWRTENGMILPPSPKEYIDEPKTASAPDKKGPDEGNSNKDGKGPRKPPKPPKGGSGVPRKPKGPKGPRGGNTAKQFGNTKEKVSK